MKINWTHIYEPHPDFLKDLHGLDEKLNVFWDGLDHDWVVVRHGETGDHEIGHYKHLDNRVLKSLYEGDLQRTTTRKFDEYIRTHNDKLKKDRETQKHDSNIEFAKRLYVDGGVREHKTQF